MGRPKANSFATESGQNQHLIAIVVGYKPHSKSRDYFVSNVSYLLLYQVDLTLHLSPQYLMKKVQAIQANLKLLTRKKHGCSCH